MRLDKQAKVEACIRKDIGRYAMHAVQVDWVDGRPRVMATDGRTLAIVKGAEPEEGDPQEDASKVRLVDPEAFKLARKGGKYLPAMLYLEEGGARVTVNGATTVFPYLEGEFPRVEAVMLPEDGHEYELHLNPYFLKNLADALTSAHEPYLKLKLRTGKGAIRVEGDLGHGYLMPSDTGFHKAGEEE